ncbi:MAG: hypothetical protein ACM359_23555 [Bacillota bacterium]
MGEKYYWYGRSYHGNDKGTYGTGGAKFRCGFNCYSSENLTHAAARPFVHFDVVQARAFVWPPGLMPQTWPAGNGSRTM